MNCVYIDEENGTCYLLRYRHYNKCEGRCENFVEEGSVPLLERQLKALRSAIAFVEGEIASGKDMCHWRDEFLPPKFMAWETPLCCEFRRIKNLKKSCGGCPVDDCHDLMKSLLGEKTEVFADILGVLKAVEMNLCDG